MKSLLIALSVLALAPLAGAATCCPPAPKDAGIVAGETAAAPLSARSLYQLDATWIDDTGRPVHLAEFRGQPVVIAMFFASCTYACPLLVGDAQRLREALPAEVRAKTKFVFVSFDSARDTSAALHTYRTQLQLDAAGWTFLRGEPGDVQELAMLLGVKYRQDAKGDFSHSNLLTVLNVRGEIVHQRAGLQGEVAAAARAVSLAMP